MVFLVSKRHPITFLTYVRKCVVYLLSRLMMIILVFPKRIFYAIWHPIDQLRIYESHKKPFMYCHMCVSKVDCATAITPNPQTDAFFNRVVTQRLPLANL